MAVVMIGTAVGPVKATEAAEATRGKRLLWDIRTDGFRVLPPCVLYVI